MPVNREQRDAAANVLASFMRGDLDRKDLNTKFEAIESALASTEIKDDHPEGVLDLANLWMNAVLSKGEWNQLRRELAFLKSDLEERDFDLPKGDVDPDPPIPHARWHALILAIAAACSFVLSWWIYAVTCAISF